MTVILPIQERTTKKDTVDLKTSIPGVVYGPKQAPVSIAVDRKEFEKLFKSAGESTVIELKGLASPVSVLVKEVSFAPTKGGIVHVDFYAIEKGKEIVTHVPLHFIGEAPATKLGAVVNKVLHEVTVSCQAADLPAHIDVDLSGLAAVESKLTVGDIVCPKGVKISEEADEIVAIAEAIAEETEEVAVEGVDMAAIEVEKKGKSEEAAV
jgi:large subunit ribosomal protein L25